MKYDKRMQQISLDSFRKYSEECFGSIMGLEDYCGKCEYQIGKIGSDTHNDCTNNCSVSDKPVSWFMSTLPCAKAKKNRKLATWDSARDIKIQNNMSNHLQHVTNTGYKLIALVLKGSQNYNLDTEDSDFDTVAIVLPEIKNMYRNNSRVSLTHILPNNEHITVIDLYTFIDRLKKCKFTTLEILFSRFVVKGDYYWIYEKLRTMREDLTRIDEKSFIKSLIGMMDSCMKTIEKNNNVQVNKHKAYILQFYNIIRKYIDGEKFEDVMVFNEAKLINKIKNIKKNGDDKTNFKSLIESSNKMKNNFNNVSVYNNIDMCEKLEELTDIVFKKYLLEELCKE